MNCKKGDLAIVVNAKGKNVEHIGKIVKCVNPFPHGHPIPAWIVEPQLGNLVLAEDCCLKPLRNTKKQDEMLRIAGKPEKVNA